MLFLPESRRVVDELARRGAPGLGDALIARAQPITELVPSCIAICLALRPSGLTVALTSPAADPRRIPASDDGRDLDDVLSERRWQQERAGDDDGRCAASIAVALYERDRITGQLSAYATDPDAFTPHADILLALVGAPPQTPVTNHDLPMHGVQDARDAPDLLAEREAVEIAVGYLMARDGLDTDTARRHLTAAARRASTDLVAFAKALVDER
jgi:ANTAR domain